MTKILVKAKRKNPPAFILRNIDPALWKAVKRSAAADHLTVRQWVFRAIRLALEIKATP